MPDAAAVLDPPLWDDERVEFLDWRDISEAEHIVILVQNVRGQLAAQDLSKGRPVVLKALSDNTSCQNYGILASSNNISCIKTVACS